jgi:hypothetical protein
MRKARLLDLGLLLPLMLSACQSPDVVARDSAASFGTLLAAIPDRITPDDNIGGYALEAPDGSARFLWSQDFSRGSVYDVWLETDIMPFVEAGLDTAKLPEGVVHEGLIIVGADFGKQPPGYPGEATAQKAFEQIVKYKRDSIKYNKAADQYSIDLGGGHMFEWAGKFAENDKDIVFVLNPQPFTAAGTDPNKIPGWTFAKVEKVDGKGNTVQADMLLKPFNIQ